jgi:hypothetical protein
MNPKKLFELSYKLKDAAQKMCKHPDIYEFYYYRQLDLADEATAQPSHLVCPDCGYCEAIHYDFNDKGEYVRVPKTP